MTIEDTFIHYGNFDVSKILNLIERLTLDWDEFDVRQRSFIEHVHTKTIPLIFNGNFNSFDLVPTKHYSIFHDELNKLESHLKDAIKKDGYIMRAILVKLLRNSVIPPHIDIVGKTLVLGKRLHIPIITNEHCLFSVGDDVRNLKVGEIWEINNDKKPHGVSNNGNEDRIHLIVDWINNDDIQ
jgi:hypothetical protein